jgi:serine/threonine protein kinase
MATPDAGVVGPALGSMIDGKYRVVRLLGRGGMGAVYEVENVKVRRSAALKLMPASASADLVSRFEAEAQAAGRAGSKRIVDVLDLGRTPDGQPYLVMELLEGETLRDELRRSRRLAPRRAAALVADVLRGLEAAHRARIVHRDLKPENIWVLAAGSDGAATGVEVPLVKILDFGVSKFATLDTVRPRTAEGVMIGTCWYMSPEQIRDARTADARSDVWAVGVILYELLSGEVPFPGTTLPEMLYGILNDDVPDLSKVMPNLPTRLTGIAMRALNKAPAGRFQSAHAMCEHLVAFLEQRAPVAEPEPAELELPLPAARRASPPPTIDAPVAAAMAPIELDTPPPKAAPPTAPPTASSAAAPVTPAPPSLPTPTPAAAPPPTPEPAPAAPVSLAEPLPRRAMEVDDDAWPRPPLFVGGVALLVMLVSIVVGALYRTGVLG